MFNDDHYLNRVAWVHVTQLASRFHTQESVLVGAINNYQVEVSEHKMLQHKMLTKALKLTFGVSSNLSSL